MTPFAHAAGRDISPKKVRWVRHPTARALLRTYFRGCGADADEIVDDRGVPVMAKRGLLGSVERAGMWAFCLPSKKVPVVYYWARARANETELAFLLGHEIGHASGRRLSSPRNGWREELRADEYGACAAAVLKHLRQRRK